MTGLVALAVVSFFRWPWWWRLISAATLTALLVVGVGKTIEPDTLGHWSEQWHSSPYAEFLLFIFLLLGMGARVLSLAIEQRRSASRSGAPPAWNIDRWEFVYPMLFAAPTFGALLGQIHAPVLTIQNVVLAFQTGFFWQTLLKRSGAK